MEEETYCGLYCSDCCYFKLVDKDYNICTLKHERTYPELFCENLAI